jgi:hypothetical protein
MPGLAPDAAYDVVGMTDTALLVVSEGQPYRCLLSGAEAGVEMGRCEPILSGERMFSARMEQLAQQEALAAAEARVVELQSALAAAQAMQAAGAADLEGLRRALEAEQVRAAEFAAQRDAAENTLASVTAQLEAAAYRADLRPQVFALEKAADLVGTVDDARVSVLARLSIRKMAEAFGDGCTIQRSAFTPENERANQEVVIAAVLAELGIAPDLGDLMMANLHPTDEAADLPHNRMKDALQTALRDGDTDTWDRGRAALTAARVNLDSLGDRIGERFQTGGLVVMAPDQQSLRVVVPPCKP